MILGLFSALVFAFALVSLVKQSPKVITIGTKPDIEQKILAEMVVILLDQHLDLKVRHLSDLEGTWVCFNALCSGSLDLYIEYSGTALMAILKEDPSRGIDFLREELSRRYDLEWLEPLGFHNSYGLFVKNKSPLNLFSELAPETISVDPEFFARKDFALLQESYGLSQKPTIMDQGLLFLSQPNVMSASTTDARILKHGLRALVDDKRILPTYEPAPLVNGAFLRQHPQVRDVLCKLKNSITQEAMIAMNARVEINSEKPYDVAFDYLKMKGLL